MATAEGVEKLMESCQKRCETAMHAHELRLDSNEKRLDNMDTTVNAMRVDTAVSKIKWMITGFIGSFIASVLVLIIAAAIMFHLGIAQIQIDHQDYKAMKGGAMKSDQKPADTPKTSDSYIQQQSSHPGWAFAEPIRKPTPLSVEPAVRIRKVLVIGSNITRGAP